MGTHQFDVVIVGAGFGGMGAAIQLNRLGYDDIVIVERENDLGGTWHVNHYPGLTVDVPSTTYSYWFEPNPYWSRLFVPGAELKRCAEHGPTSTTCTATCGSTRLSKVPGGGSLAGFVT